MNLPVPCPSCGGLVARKTLACSVCGHVWESLAELLFDGLCGTSERMVRIAESAEWGFQALQDIMNLFSLNTKYNLEIERMEKR